MIYSKQYIDGVYLLTPEKLVDKRGYFYESFNCYDFWANTGYELHFSQENVSCSAKNVVRGFHFQEGENAQSKLVKVLNGSIIDFALDIRKDSETFGKFVMAELTAENQKQLFIPKGFAHAFISMEDNTIVQYKVDTEWIKSSERGIRFDSPEIENPYANILKKSNCIISEKDLSWPTLTEYIETIKP